MIQARNTAFSAFDEAERKILQALKRENEIALDQLGKAQRHLFPFGKPQERILNAILLPHAVRSRAHLQSSE